jgi:hypothetical protein
MVEYEASKKAIQLYMKILFIRARGWEETSPWRFTLLRYYLAEGQSASVEEAFRYEIGLLTGDQETVIFDKKEGE